MDITLRFKLDVKKNVYVSKKMEGLEPYYQICAIIRINHKEVNYFTGFLAQKSAWFSSASEAERGDKNRSFGIHKGCYAKKRSLIVQYADVNRVLDLISASIVQLSATTQELTKEELIRTLDEVVGKRKTSTSSPISETVEPAESSHLSFWTLFGFYCNDPKVSAGRNKTRINAMQHLKRYECLCKSEVTFEMCNVKFLTDFQIYLQNDDGRGEHIVRGRKNHNPRKKNGNTISKIMATIKQFFKWCRIRYGITTYGNVDDYQVPAAKYGDPITITQEEKRALFDFKFDEKDKVLEWTRDLLFFQCSIGARVSDFFALKYENLYCDKNGLSIRYCPKKTQDVTAIFCRIPLTSHATAILEKYRVPDAAPKTPLFPFPKNKQTYNYHLKATFKKVGLDRIVMVQNAYGRAEYRPLYELAKSKFARSNFIDTLVSQEVSDNIIATMSGHTPGSRAFHRYHNSQKEEQQNAAIRLLD